jgi:hypothetical protein
MRILLAGFDGPKHVVDTFIEHNVVVEILIRVGEKWAATKMSPVCF